MSDSKILTPEVRPAQTPDSVPSPVPIAVIAQTLEHAPTSATMPSTPQIPNDNDITVSVKTPSVAMITDYGDITDLSFNQTTYEACKSFATAAGLTFQYYTPVADTDKDRIDSIKKEIKDGYTAIIMPGYAFAMRSTRLFSRTKILFLLPLMFPKVIEVILLMIFPQTSTVTRSASAR